MKLKRKANASLGRPPDAGEPRDATVRLRVTDAEKARWLAAAAVNGVGLSEWIRGACEGEALLELGKK